MTCDPEPDAERGAAAAFLEEVGVLADGWRAARAARDRAAAALAGVTRPAGLVQLQPSTGFTVPLERVSHGNLNAAMAGRVGAYGTAAQHNMSGGRLPSPDPAAIGAAAFTPPPRAHGEAERQVVSEALECGEDTDEALAAYRRRPGPLAGLDDAARLVVAPGPGPHRQAWRMTAAGVWFAYAGEPCAEFLPATDPARPERMTAAALAARLAR